MLATRFLVTAALGFAFAGPGAAVTLVPDNVYAAPQQLVAIDGERRLNLYCVGSGEPAIVLEAGAGNGMVTWRFVQSEIGKFTRVCAYDRAGLGFSDAAERPSDLGNMTEDLARLVAAAGVVKPFVLVGHSLGGQIAVLYATMHPDDLAGMVLVDPGFANDLEALQAQLPEGARSAIQDAMTRALNFKRACLELARAGKLASLATSAARGCINVNDDPNRLDAALRQLARRQLQDPKVWEAQASEMAAFVPEGDHLDTDSAELDASTFAFGHKPLIVLSRGVDEGGPGVPPDALARVEAAWRAGHAALATCSTQGVHIVVPNSRHYVQIDEPAAVIDAVRRAVLAVRGK
ncbi:MAG: alpha/beta hydrolase [Hyphomicrobiales bacterium]|nr:alpha/beta hydrolase [Hyphomicrobiales bacterium]MBV8441307.1 alpha/beta hydrolase [Hyphomicrobiales bacterium]